MLSIDTNGIILCHQNELLVLPDRFKEFPPLAVDVRISGLVPDDLDPKWDKKSTNIVKKWLELKDDCHFQAKIQMAVMNCVWVKTIELIQKLPSIKEEIMKLSVKDNVIKENIGVADPKSLETLRTLAEKAGGLAFILSHYLLSFIAFILRILIN